MQVTPKAPIGGPASLGKQRLGSRATAGRPGNSSASNGRPGRTAAFLNSARNGAKGYKFGNLNQGYRLDVNSVLRPLKDSMMRTFGYDDILWLRQRIEIERVIMLQDRSTFETWWLEAGRYFSPRRTRFLPTDVNKGWRRNQQIIDDTGGQCKDVLAAGMLAGICSPTRLWFSLTTGDAALDADQTVKDWCYDVSQRMAAVFYKSNLYEEMPLLFEDSAVFGSGLVWMEEHDTDVVAFQSQPIGSWMVSHDSNGRVVRMYREFMLTCTQLLDMFGIRDDKGRIVNWENFSQAVRTAHDTAQLGMWFYVGHSLRPNHRFEPEAPGVFGYPVMEAYFELGQAGVAAPGVNATAMGIEQWRFLRLRGLEKFPVMELIWKKTGMDDYGTECPGVRTIGDVRQLQAQEMRVSQASEKMINPAIQGPPPLRTARPSLLAGDVTYTPANGPGQGYRAIHETNLNIQMMEERSDRIRNRIAKGWYYDLFMMLQNESMGMSQEGVQPITAEEVKEKQQEKLLMLSPVLEKANRTALKPLIEFTFLAMLKRGMIPPPPAKMRGRSLSVEFNSVFAQAMKLIEVESLKDFSGWITSQAQAGTPEVLDVVDHDEMVRQYADKISVPPILIRPEEDVQKIRQQRQQAQAREQQLKDAETQARTARALAGAKTDPSDPNAYQDLVQQSQAAA